MYRENADRERIQHGAYRRRHVGLHRVPKRTHERNGVEQYLP